MHSKKERGARCARAQAQPVAQKRCVGHGAEMTPSQACHVKCVESGSRTPHSTLPTTATADALLNRHAPTDYTPPPPRSIRRCVASQQPPFLILPRFMGMAARRPCARALSIALGCLPNVYTCVCYQYCADIISALSLLSYHTPSDVRVVLPH